jgi:hypothetical protein
MKYLGFVIVTLITVFQANGQNAIPNPGFEHWETGGSLLTYEEPVGWGTSNPETVLFQFQTATKTSVAQFVRSGNLALRLETHYIGALNLAVPGGVATADLDINLANQSVEPVGGVAFNLRPSALEGWYQYYPAGPDSARVGMLLSRWNADTQVRDTIATAIFETTEQADSYTQFIAPFEYQSDLDPDTMLLGILCGKVEDAPIGTVMYVDDLDLIYGPVSVANSDVHTIPLYPNPTRGQVRFGQSEAEVAEVFDINGTRLRVIPLQSGQQDFDLSELRAGVFIVKFSMRNGLFIGQSRLVIIR